MNDQISQIQKTASTLFDLSNHSDVAYSHQIADLMIKKIGIEWPRISIDDFSAFPVSRFNTNQSIIDLFSKKFGTRLQIIELGAGFTPHYLNLKTKVFKYVEVEYESSSNLKKEIISEINPYTPNLEFVSGDILEANTWKKVKGKLDLNNPVIIFSEGVIAPYFDTEQKNKIGDFIKELLTIDGSAFILDDTLRNHPELRDKPIIVEGMQRIINTSGSNIYNAEFQTFDREVQRWKELLPDKKVVTVDYVKSKPTMDFVISNFKMIILLQDTQVDIETELIELSKQSKVNRIWK